MYENVFNIVNFHKCKHITVFAKVFKNKDFFKVFQIQIQFFSRLLSTNAMPETREIYDKQYYWTLSTCNIYFPKQHNETFIQE